MDLSTPSCLQLYGVRVLVADNSLAGSLLALMLTREGATAQIARSSAELSTALPTYNPDAIICELRLPGESITALIPWLKTCQRPVEQPRTVIVLTTRADEQSRLEAEDAGCDGFFTKPTGIEQIIALIHQSQVSQIPEA